MTQTKLFNQVDEGNYGLICVNPGCELYQKFIFAFVEDGSRRVKCPVCSCNLREIEKHGTGRDTEGVREKA